MIPYLIGGAMLPSCAMYFVAEQFLTECTKYPGRFKNAGLAANVRNAEARRETKRAKKRREIEILVADNLAGSLRVMI
jgi:hypothetical protein